MNNRKLHGVIVPVITPLDAQEDVDEAAFRKGLRRLIHAGVHGIFVGGSAGEGPLLVDAQWRRMVEIAFNEVGDDVPLLAGAIDTSARRAREPSSRTRLPRVRARPDRPARPRAHARPTRSAR